MKVVNLIRRRGSESWTNTFIIDDSVRDPETAIRNAIEEFLKTEDGWKAIEKTNGAFDFGDAVFYVPEKIWKKHGLKLGGVQTIDILVPQDEVLCKDLYECTLCGKIVPDVPEFLSKHLFEKHDIDVESICKNKKGHLKIIFDEYYRDL